MYLIALFFCLIFNINAYTPTVGKTFFSPRSVGSDMARWLAGSTRYLYLAQAKTMNGALFITPQYNCTSNPDQLAQFLFFNGASCMNVGPAISNPDGTRNKAGVGTDIFATNFFLNNDFLGSVCAKPLIQHAVFDINFYLGLDGLVPNLFFRLDLPFAWTSWNMQLSEEIVTPGNTIAAETFGNVDAAPSPLTSIIQAWKGQTLDTENFPQLKQRMLFNRVDGAQKKFGLADITLMLGYNFYLSEKGHFGLSATAILPTEYRPSPEFLFTPVIGNGKYNEVGMGITAHWQCWQNPMRNQSCGFYLEGVMYHVLPSNQKRTFDLTHNGVGSHYLLLKKFTGTTPLTYNDEIIFGTNVMTLECEVSNTIHADIALMFDYQYCNFNFDIGYNLWARSKDIINITDTIPLTTFGVQGATQTAGPSIDNTQSQSTIIGLFSPAFPGDAQPIKTNNIDKHAAQHPAAISHKFFANITYTWQSNEYLTFAGLGGQYEFSYNNNNAADQWSVWIKTGFSFN